MSSRIELAGGLIRNEEHKMLLIHRNTPALVQWELPGGKVEADETPVRAMNRELKEELDVDVEMAGRIGRIVFTDRWVEYGYTWYDVDIVGEPKIMEPDRHDQIGYFSVDEMESMTNHLSKNVLEFLRLLKLGEIQLNT